MTCNIRKHTAASSGTVWKTEQFFSHDQEMATKEHVNADSSDKREYCYLPLEKWVEDLVFVGAYSTMKMGRRELCSHKYFCLLFCANWCPPCKMFVRSLADSYKKIRDAYGQDQLEIVFVSYDKSEEEFDEFLLRMPWYAVPWKEDARNRFKFLFSVTHIPTLLLFDHKRRLICENARGPELLLGVGCDPLQSWEYLINLHHMQDKKKDGSASNAAKEKKNAA